MKILRKYYEKKGESVPYYCDYSLLVILTKPIRKYVAQVIAPNCPFNFLRIFFYRLCGFKIGKKTFIGMRCYLDDMCYDKLIIGNHVTISYGVYFACHGKKQEHYPIIIHDGAYIGMRASIISNNADKSMNGVEIGEKSIIGACALVNRNVPNGATAVGIPCKVILNEETKNS